MKKNKKRAVAALLASALLLLSLGACGIDTSNIPGISSALPQTTTAAPAPAQREEKQQSTALDEDVHFSVESAATLPAASGKAALATTDIYKKCAPSVVAIATTGVSTNFFGQQAEYPSAGSGVIISKDGYVLTCNHVIEEMKTIDVLTSDGKKYEAKVVGGDKRTDLAVLKIEAKNLSPIALGNSDQLQIGELAVAIGNPLGEFANSLSVGVISGTDRELNLDGQVMNLLQTDASISPGNSGGALINSYGELVGITSAKSSGTGVEGIGFAIPINDAKKVVNELVNNGYVSRPVLGIVGMTVDKDLQDYVKEYTKETGGQAAELPKGVLITEITQGGAADKAGLDAGDVITKINGKACDSIEALKELIDASKIGDKIALTVIRNGKTRTASVTLAEEPRSTATPAPEASYGLPDYLEEYFRGR